MKARYCSCHKSDRGCDEPCTRSRHYRADDLTLSEAAKWRAGRREAAMNDAARDMRDRCVALLRAEAVIYRQRAWWEPDALDEEMALEHARLLEARAAEMARLEPVEQPEPVRSPDNFYDVSSLRDDISGLEVRGG